MCLRSFSSLSLFLLLPLLARAQDADLASCLNDPSQTLCSTLTYPEALAISDREALCRSMPNMVGCTVAAACQSASNNPAYCQSFSLLADICAEDMPRMGGCRNYTKLCSSGSVVEQCTKMPKLANLPKSSQVAAQVYGICNSMTMDGCSSCTFNTPTSLPNCDILGTYAKLCIAMPAMPECQDFSTLCSSNPTLAICPSSNPGDGSKEPIAMMMYFHNSPTYVVFQSWVPRTPGDFAWTMIVFIFLGMLSESLVAVRHGIERTKLVLSNQKQSIIGTDNESALSNGDLIEGRPRSFNSIVPWTAVATIVKFVEVMLHYVLMLAAMSFNVKVFFAVVTGIALGYPLSRYIKSRFTPPVSITSRKLLDTCTDDTESSTHC